ncbi:BPL-N domain-containing protein [Rhodopirellula bahusiensis]|uniref:BPL-N domain-containing protein n=1 Tax=Rhodopirellula bahusiensis TaxID=2014065 RepID=UPI003267AB7C
MNEHPIVTMPRLRERFLSLAGSIVCLILAADSIAAEQCIRVAVYQGDGAGGSSTKLIRAFGEDSVDKFEIERITADEIVVGELAEFDVLVHPGGSGGKQGRALGEEGRAAVRDFVQQGGGYLGVCAGAYLATNDYSWSLNLIDAKVVDRKHWARGNGKVELQLSEEAVSFFGLEEAEAEIYYAQGPLLGRREWDDPEVPDYESLAIYSSEIAKKGAPEGVMEGTSAAVRCDYGDGRVFCFGPHPELTDGLEHWIPTVVDWLADE